MGGPQVEPGGIIDEAGAAAGLARDARLPGRASGRRASAIEIRETQGRGIRKVRVCKRADCGQDIDR